jgi:ribosome-associated toxin RatA of RatAB toxin-antitoxin module
MSVDVRGDIDRLYALASDVPRWAEFLPHYRYVRVLATEGAQRTVVMAARRGPMPLRWRSVLELVPEERRIIFQHIGGPARGMYVEWRIEQHEGYARATITHDLDRLAYPIVAMPLGRYILAHWFIDPVAGKTLGYMRDLVESGRDRAARGLSS